MTGPVATTAHGAIRGSDSDGVRRFLGIPYAAPAVGELRWCPPQPPTGWVGEHDGTRAGAIMPQNPGRREHVIGAEGAQREGALELNVWTPGITGRRPVLVWLHGGSFLGGSGLVPWYSGAALARRGDVVVVTCNYRLGALGFLHLDDVCNGAVEDTANLGLRDQIAVLEWVTENIAAFGGNADDVTLFGESAGATSAAALMTMPKTSGRFRRAIVQSFPGASVSSRERANWVAERTLAILGIASDDVALLRSVAVDRLLDAETVVAGELAAGGAPGGPTAGLPMPFLPVVDGSMLVSSPVDAMRAGAGRHIQLVVGSTADEFAATALGDPSLQNLTDDGLRTRTEGLGAEEGRRVFDAYRAAHPHKTPFERYVRQLTDAIFTVPVRRLADAHEGATFRYWFSYPSRAFDGRLGATHGIEIPFVFHNLDDPWATHVLGSVGESAYRLADLCADAWLAFARSGDPNHGTRIGWPAWDDDAWLMELGESCGARADPVADVLPAWEGII